MAETPQWQIFLHWATRVAALVDLKAGERDYKVGLADRLARVRELVLAGAPDWPERLMAALDPNKQNLLHWQFVDDFRKNLARAPDQARVALLAVWSNDEPRVDNLDDLANAMSRLPDHDSPGNVIAFGSALLMSMRPGNYPPYRPRPVTKWLKLLDIPAPKSAEPPSTKYSALLGFLDEFIAKSADHELQIADRLDAQGLAWATTQWPMSSIDPQGTWPAEDTTAFLQWRGEAPGLEAAEAQGRRAWLVRPKPDGGPLVERWRREEFVSLRATYLGEVPPGSDLATVRSAVDAGYQHQDYGQRIKLTAEYHDFLTRMKPDDIVMTHSDEQVQIGVVLGDAEYSPDTQARLRRSVAWQDEQFTKADLPAPIPGLLDLQGTVIDLTGAVDMLEDLIRERETVAPPRGSADSRRDGAGYGVPTLRPADDALAAKLHMPREALQEIIDLLQSRQQLVLYGPPGTGKTYLAQAIAEHLVGAADTSRAQLVQFHPAYSYEDFFEGFRPSSTETGQATFTVQPGPLRRIAGAAADPENRREPFVLIIDEMNRTNLAKVFGELYFLLEYRNKSVQLQYNPTEGFQLPSNLFIIGTMNTSDRSIAMVDAAIRRRFPFVELHPDEMPVRDVLASYLAANGKSDSRSLLLAALNAEIDESDRDLRIGPSYLMRPAAETEAGLELIWKYDILPLLDEHYYGRLTPKEIRSRFGLSALLAQLRPAESAVIDAGPSDDSDPASDPGSDPASFTGPVAS